MKNRKELFSKIAYACGDIYGGGAFIIVGLLLLVYLTNVEGFSGTTCRHHHFHWESLGCHYRPLYGATVRQNPIPFWSSPHLFPSGQPSCIRILGNAMVWFWYHWNHCQIHILFR